MNNFFASQVFTCFKPCKRQNSNSEHGVRQNSKIPQHLKKKQQTFKWRLKCHIFNQLGVRKKFDADELNLCNLFTAGFRHHKGLQPGACWGS